MKGQEERKAVFLPQELYRKVENRVATTEFRSVDEYVTFVLEEVVKEESGDESFSQEDEQEVKKRLKALGYLD